MSGKTKALFLLVVAVAVFSGAVFSSSAQNDAVEMLGFHIQFEGVEYDAGLNESKWFYSIEGRQDAPHDLSHWDLALCAPAHVVVQQGGGYKTSHPEVKIGTNPHTDIQGIKFDVKVKKGETVDFWFVLQGNWETEAVEIGSKAGLFVDIRTIVGPSCEPAMCEVHYSVESGRNDFRVLRPGMYASVLSVIQLSGTGTASLQFDDFDHVKYLADPAAPPIEMQFGFGNTLDEADASGWLAADELNNHVLQFNPAEIEGGVALTIWVRLLVEDYHFSSDYEVSGNLRLTTNCPF